MVYIRTSAGSYVRLVALYTLVPLSSLLVFVLLALLPVLVYSYHTPDSYPHPKYFPFPLPEILASASLWSLSHLLRVPLHSLFYALVPCTLPAIFLSTFSRILLHNLLRVASFPILLVHMDHIYPTWHDPSFRRVWWIALGWSFAEVIVGVAQGYEQIALYRDVLVPEGKDEEFFSQRHQRGPARFSSLPPEESGLVMGPPTMLMRGDAKGKNTCLPEDDRISEGINNGRVRQQRFGLDDTIKVEVDCDFDRLVSFKEREELEEVYGIPAIVCLIIPLAYYLHI
jgi:hypothetical protein